MPTRIFYRGILLTAGCFYFFNHIDPLIMTLPNLIMLRIFLRSFAQKKQGVHNCELPAKNNKVL